jgi:hypothetical protein
MFGFDLKAERQYCLRVFVLILSLAALSTALSTTVLSA